MKKEMNVKAEAGKYLGFVMLYRFIALGLINGAFSLLLAVMIEDMGFDMTQRAMLVTVNSMGQLVASFVIGFLIDRVNSKIVLSAVMIVASLTTILRFFASSYSLWVGLMAVWGFCYGALIVANLKVMGLWFAKEKIHRVNGLFVLAGPLGQFIGLQIALDVVAKVGGWRNYYLILGIIALISGLLVLFLCKNRTNEETAVPKNFTKEETGLVKDIVALAKIPRYWLLVISELGSSCMISIVATYAVLVLQNDARWGLELPVARRVTQMIMLGAVIGYFVVPQLTAAFKKKFKSPEIGVAGFTIICGFFMATLYIIAFTSFNYNLALVLCLIGGITQGGYIAGAKSIMIMLPECSGARAGTAMSMTSIISRIGLVIMSAAAGAYAAATADSASVMVLLYAPIYVGTAALVVFIFVQKAYEKKHAA